MKTQIEDRRRRLQGKVKPASRPESTKAPAIGGRKLDPVKDAA